MVGYQLCGLNHYNLYTRSGSIEQYMYLGDAVSCFCTPILINFHF